MKVLAGLILSVVLSVSTAFAGFFPEHLTANQVANVSCDDGTVHLGDSNFCSAFDTVGICHCKAQAGPLAPVVCRDMKTVYDHMVQLYRSVENACRAQHFTDTQTCIDDWNCYTKGGKSSNGTVCSGTGNACMSNALLA